VSKLINLEVMTIEDGYVVLESEGGIQIEMEESFLPDNLREGKFLRFVISHTDYDPDKQENYIFKNKSTITGLPDVVNGRKLMY